VSGRGRKQPNRGGKARRPQSVPKKGGGPGGTAKAGVPQQRQQPPAHPAAAKRTGDTQPVADVGSHRPSGTAPGSSLAARQARADRKRRNQRLGVIIGAVALGGAAVGSVIAGMAGGSEPTGQAAGASSSPTASVGPEAVAGPTVAATASAAPATPVPMAMTCPTGGGASTLFGHDITVPAPYTVTIVYGDGDKYTNDSAHLNAIFSHTYKKPGTYTVNAVLTNPAGQMASATCDYTWGP
jgi:hypothetical protein